MPGRHEPGSGTVDWRKQVTALRDVGYAGLLGLEFEPREDTRSSLTFIRQLVGQT